MSNKIAKMIIPVDLVYLASIQAFIAEQAHIVKFSNKDILLFNVAVEEAVSNVIKHAFLPDEDATFEIICKLTSTEFKVIIKDKGLPFDPEQVEEFEVKDMEKAAQSGLGFRLMKGSVDKLSFFNKGYGGKEVHLVKFIDQRHIDELVQTSKMVAFEQPSSKSRDEITKIAFHAEMLQSKYAIEISQCAYKTYGYTYIMENIYYPDRLIEMTKTGELISAVAVTDDTGEVMTHCALERFGRKKDVPELGMAFTKPKFRGQGCLKALTALLLDSAKEQNIKGVYAKAVTTHPFSQKAVRSGGLKVSAIQIGLSPAKTFAKMDSQGAQRESLVLCYLKLLKHDKLNLFMIEKHKDIVEKAYANMGIETHISTPDFNRQDMNINPQSDVEIDIIDSLNYANIYINSSGENLQLEIKQRLKELCQKKIEAINLYMDMYDPLTVSKIEELKELGFFFAGVFPNDKKQYFIMQYLNNVPIDYSKIVTVTDFATDLLEYIKQQDPNLE
jgi:anti-sigma regulatory factor (Ser/Thr protein kinase)